MRIAVVGSGIAGLASAWLLSRTHEVTLYEANDYLGGHTHTHDIELRGRRYAIDSGFIVHNPDHYPLLTRLFAELGVASQPTTMSFSVHNEASGLEYNAATLGTLFCQRRNLVSPRFLGLVRDLVRFYRDAALLLEEDGEGLARPVIIRYNLCSMKLAIRRIGNSLGVIIPRKSLEAWGIGEGDHLQLTERGINAAAPARRSHEMLDELKRSIALAVVRNFTAREIRAQILANLYRWQQQGAWVSAYDEWRGVAKRDDDGALFAAMLGRDERAVRLRQSMPFVGLLPQEEVRRLHEEAAA